jgi:hypothetical protein
MTATHQLKNAVASVAYAGRPLLLTSLSGGIQSDDSYSSDAYLDLIFTSLSNALLGMDANDPPKTVATMQLIGSIFSNVSTSHNSVTWITRPGSQELVKNCLSFALDLQEVGHFTSHHLIFKTFVWTKCFVHMKPEDLKLMLLELFYLLFFFY